MAQLFIAKIDIDPKHTAKATRRGKRTPPSTLHRNAEVVEVEYTI